MPEEPEKFELIWGKDGEKQRRDQIHRKVNSKQWKMLGKSISIIE